MIVELPDAEIRDTGLTASLAKIELAVALYRDRKVSLGHGARIAHLPTPEFLQEVGRRNVAVNYDLEEFDRDLREIENLWWLSSATHPRFQPCSKWEKAGMLDQIFGNVVVPAAVYDELAVCHDDLPDWVHRVEVQNLSAVQSLLLHLDRGESEAIVLAGELGADFLLMDEKAGREIARQQGRHAIGILGVALLAKRQGILGCTMTDLIFDLRELEARVVASAEE